VHLNLYLAFVAAASLMIFLPGPSVMLTVAHGLAFGRCWDWRSFERGNGPLYQRSYILTHFMGVNQFVRPTSQTGPRRASAMPGHRASAARHLAFRFAPPQAGRFWSPAAAFAA
jgi:hypothetical protein